MSTIPLAEARARLSALVDDAVTTHERTDITRNGHRAAVLLGADDYDALIETLDVLSDAALVADIRAALDATGKQGVVTTEELLDSLPPSRRGRR